jgi:hypothetical protein
MRKTIKELSVDVYNNAVSKGWYDNGAACNMGERIALIHAEVSEMLEADRNSEYCDRSTEALQSMMLHDDDKFKEMFEVLVKGTFEEELADVVIRCLDMAAFKKIDLEHHILCKMRYNTLRPIRHGGKKY